jgi:hypothetical protein
MAKKKLTETTIPSDDLIAQAVLEGQALISEGKTKVEAAMAIYRHLNESPQEVVLQAFVDGASLKRACPLPYSWEEQRRLLLDMRPAEGGTKEAGPSFP